MNQCFGYLGEGREGNRYIYLHKSHKRGFLSLSFVFVLLDPGASSVD